MRCPRRRRGLYFARPRGICSDASSWITRVSSSASNCIMRCRSASLLVRSSNCRKCLRFSRWTNRCTGCLRTFLHAKACSTSAGMSSHMSGARQRWWNAVPAGPRSPAAFRPFEGDAPGWVKAGVRRTMTKSKRSRLSGCAPFSPMGREDVDRLLRRGINPAV